ncbi:hypothetical protein JW935_26625 [candidate division KSB1 bacterium]|nr:hypothetical protein [candidate division KSB1 bacterium]
MSLSIFSFKKNEWGFFCRSLSILLALFVLVAVAFFLLPKSKEKYVACINDKMELMRSMPSPRIILVGGSNLAFGIDSPLLEELTGYHVINFGIHARLRYPFMLEVIEPYFKSGDIVVFGAEYALIQTDKPDKALWETVAEYPPGIKYIKWREMDFSTFMLAFQKRIQRSLNLKGEFKEPIYRRSGFNFNGDLVTHLSLAPRDTMHCYQNFNDMPERSIIDYLNRFYERCREKGVKAMYSFPPFPGQDVDQTHLSDWFLFLQNSLEIPLISHPSNYFYPKDYFFDSCFHLTATGREARTIQLAADINAAL